MELTNEFITRFESSSLRGLEELVQGLTDVDRREIERHLEGRAEFLARAAAYVGTSRELGHERAVKNQNSVGQQVRLALGYHVRRDINF